MTDAQERADEQWFWDAAFCAALGGLLSSDNWRTSANGNRKPGEKLSEVVACAVAEVADAALAVRRQRKEQE